jgi:polar amino acid transport system permease protein
MNEYTFQFGPVLAYWPQLAAGIVNTILYCFLGIVSGVVFGTLMARLAGSRFLALRAAVTGYVDVIRNTPLLVQLFFIYLGLPALGIALSPGVAAAIALVANTTSYTTEILRAGLAAVPRSNVEAGIALGFTPRQVFRYFVFLPALEKVYPALTSQFILLMLATSILSAIGAEELTSAANSIQSFTFRSFETYFVVALIYLVLVVLFRLMFWGLSLVLFPHRGART